MTWVFGVPKTLLPVKAVKYRMGKMNSLTSCCITFFEFVPGSYFRLEIAVEDVGIIRQRALHAQSICP